MILGAFKLLPLAWKLGIVAASLVALAGTYAYWHHSVFEAGYDKAIADVQAENRFGKDAALQNVQRRRACAGTWSQSRGVCE